MSHPLYPNARGDCYACSIAVNTQGVGCAAHSQAGEEARAERHVLQLDAVG